MRKPAESAVAGDTPLDRAAPPADSLEGVFSQAPPWLVSMIIHASLLLIVGLAAAEVHRRQATTMDVELAAPDHSADEIYAEKLGEQLEREQPTVNNPLATEVDTGYSMSDLPAVDDPLAAAPKSPDIVSGGDGYFSTVDAPSIGFALSGRQEGRKDALLRAYGGTATTQESVELALKWLMEQQRSDGSWSLRGPYENGGASENSLAATAMALLAFLGDGHTHVKDGPYRKTVTKAMNAIIKAQGSDGEFQPKGAPFSHRLYTHAQCTIAMCELYAITQDSHVREVASKAVNYCVKIQAPQGGWRYNPEQESDLSVTGWFVMALESARMGHLEVPTPTFDRIGEFLDSVSAQQGAVYSYLPDHIVTPAMTAEALLCRQYLGWAHDDPRLQQGVDYLSQHPVDWSSPNVYHWYYATQVMHHMGGKPWVEWNKVMRQEIPSKQVRTGKERGSWSPNNDQWGSTSGRLYMTCLSTFMLEVYYRHLPLYALEMKGDEAATQTSAAATESSDAGAP